MKEIWTGERLILRILVHDYPGHPFQVQLSRELARRGHTVTHLYAGYNQTPRGMLTRLPGDPATFHTQGIFIKQPLQKYAFLKRWIQEREYGRLLARQIKALSPEVVISANTPLDAQVQALGRSRQIGAKFVFWLQDVIGLATDKLLRGKIPVLGTVLGRYYVRLERRLLQKSDRVILITEDFQALLDAWGINREKTHVIPNWAPIEDIPLYPKKNEWSQRFGVADKFCFLYTGTLGMKHNPDLLLQFARHFSSNDGIAVLVVSEGPGADWLKAQKQALDLQNLKIVDFQPFEQMPMVLAAGDVLVAILESNAGIFSVPSKVLTYLCARKPLLLSVPHDNLASKIVSRNNAGLTASPTDVRSFLGAADLLVEDRDLREGLAQNAYQYARSHFDIEKITDRFESVLNSVL